MLNERNTLLEDDGIEEEILVEEECSVAQAVWGDIQGNIENQTDLQNALDAKQDSLTEAQLNAVNSGITSEKVTTYDGYADQIASKANQSALNTEATTREQADTALGRRIDEEATARQQADNGLQTQIDAITSKSDVVDVVANYAALQAYDTSSLGNNDVIKVLDDETHEDALTYYRWSTATQTWSYIGQEAPYYSKGQMDVKLAEKQDKLTAGANIQIQNGTISATDTTYTAGNGLHLNGTEFSADTDILATKDDLEDHYTKPEVDNLLLPKLEAELVAELPTTGAEGKLYLTPKNYTRGTGTGNPIEATITDEAGKMESFKLDGDTYQQTYSGKNLLMNKASAQEKTGITITPNSDGSFTLNGTATVVTDFYFAGSWSNRTISYLDMTSGDYTASLLDSNKQHVASPKFRFELYDRMGESSTRILWYYGVPSPLTITLESPAQVTAYYISIPNGTSFSNEKFYIQLEKGSTATSFEKYVGGQPSPNPDYPQQIQTVTGEQTITVVGKNLFDGEFEVGNISQSNGLNVAQSNMIRSKNYAIVAPETEYTISADGINSVALRFYRSDGVYIDIGTSGASPNTFTTPKGTGRVRFVLTGTEDTTKKAQMELGGSASTWEAYRTPTIYPINLGKNMFNGVTTPQVISANGNISDNGAWALSQNIPVMPGTKYTVSWKLAGSDVSVLITEWKKDGTFIIRHGRQASTSYTFTATSETAYIRLNYNVSYGNSDYMLEAGDTATTYAPYKTPIELCKLGTYQDYIWKDGEDWKVHKNIASTRLTSSYGWLTDHVADQNRLYISSENLAGAGVRPSSNIQIGQILSTHFSPISITNLLAVDSGIGISQTGFISIRDNEQTTANGFKDWLDNNNIYAYYALATSTDTTITDQALIAQLEAIRTASLQNGTNTITNTATGSNLAGDMEISYYGFAPRNRYDKWLWLDINNEYEQIGS